jgi:hypothetical protein
MATGREARGPSPSTTTPVDWFGQRPGWAKPAAQRSFRARPETGPAPQHDPQLAKGLQDRVSPPKKGVLFHASTAGSNFKDRLARAFEILRFDNADVPFSD